MAAPKLKRELSLIDLTFASVGGMIGSGWLFASMNAAKIAGPSALLSWLVGGIAVALIGLVYAELGGMLPEPGAVVRYPQYSHGTFVSWIMGWGAWLTWVTVAPVEAEAVVQYANSYIHGLYNSTTNVLTPVGLLFAVILIAIFVVLNYFGVRVFARVNTIVTWFKYIVPALTIVLLLFGGFHGSNFSAAHGGFAPYGISAALTAVGTSGIVFAYLGFRQGVEMAGEARNPARDVPRAILIAIGIVFIVYFLLQLAFVGAVPGRDLVKGWANIGAVDANLASGPFAAIATALNFGWLATLLYIDAWISPSGTGLVYTASTARAVFSLSRNGYLPKFLQEVHPKYRVPHWALIVNFIAGIIALAPFPSWSRMIGFISVTGFATYLMGPIAAMVLRRTGAALKRPMKVAGLPVVALLAFIVSSLIMYWAAWPTTLYAIGAIVVGILIYVYFFYKSQFDRRDVIHGLWLAVYLVILMVVSYIGSSQFGGKNYLPAPWDTVVVAVLSVIFFFIGVGQGFETKDVREAVANQEAIMAD